MITSNHCIRTVCNSKAFGFLESIIHANGNNTFTLVVKPFFKGVAHFKDYRMKLVTSFELEEILDVLSYVEENQDEFAMVY